MKRLLLVSTAAAMTCAGAPVLAQSMDRDTQMQVTIDDGTTDMIDRQPRYDHDYAARTPRGNLVAYDVDGDGWVTYRMDGETYVVRDADRDGYVLRTDVQPDADIDVITVTYDPRALESLPGDYDAAYLIDQATAEEIFVRDARISEGGRHTALADRNDVVVSGGTHESYVVQDARLAASDVTEVWAAPRAYGPAAADRPMHQDRGQADYRTAQIEPDSVLFAVSPVRQVFLTMDANNDLVVSRQEWGNWQADEGFYADRWDEFDRDGDDILTWEEYATSVNEMYDLSRVGM